MTKDGIQIQRRGDNAAGTVLVVEDSRALQGLLSSYLNGLYGLKTVATNSLAETRAQLATGPERFFCAVLDLNLPDAPNGEVVDLVQQYGIPVIVLTASIDAARRQIMISKRVVDYFVKRNLSEIEHVAHVVNRLWENCQMKVLVVDDSRSFRTYLQSLLGSYRYQTFVAGNGKEALTLLTMHPDISLVITDVNMPEMDGLVLIETIRRQYRREDLVVIGMSDVAKPGLSALLLKAGANDFIAKPFQVEELFCRVTQNTNMINYVRQLRQAATLDFLTGLANRRHTLELGEALYAQARHGDLAIALAMVDADHFKLINDRFGHLVGDEALKAIASALRQTWPDTDVLGRYGGEEFLGLVTLQPGMDIAALFEQARAEVAAIDLIADGQRAALTVSIGFTTELGNSLIQMIERADNAAYQAKAEGRNRVVRQ
ncbi:MAG: diguanylate cyclase [Candidatus Competibacteraceae bacterium]|nr:MAG: diguanylate cyclase [Candidatus Competibacteraceae bacterium]